MIEQRQRHEAELADGRAQLHQRSVALDERELAVRQAAAAAEQQQHQQQQRRGAPPAAAPSKHLQEREQRVHLAELQLAEQRDGLLGMQQQVTRMAHTAALRSANRDRKSA